MLIVKMRNLLGLLALGLIAACTTPPPGPDPDPAPGALAITVGNLPAGVPAAVRVTGPSGYAQDVTGSQTLTNLAPGEYTVTANSVLSGGLAYMPSAGLQVAVVAPRATTQISISYTGVAFGLGLEEVANVPSAVFLTSPPGDARQFIVAREGLIHVRENGAILPTPFLDIHERVLSHSEGGLLSMAFHPDYASNGYFYLFFTDKLHGIVIARYRVSSERNRADGDSELVIIRVQKLNNNHNGGLVSFGPDGYLYFATGDDGGTGDPYRNGQDLGTLLAKLIRIDVANARLGERYRIPPTNPFVGQEGRRPEIWAYGLRNPWRFSFDANLLYLTDVGQEQREEVNISSIAQGGLNYGWNIMEGSICYDRPTCDRTGLTLPTFEYDHGNGCAIVGGYVYRGSAIPELTGHYFYSDLCRGFLRSFVYTGTGIAAPTDWLISGAGNIQSFGRDADGELYLIATNGRIFRVVRTSAPAGEGGAVAD